MVCYYYLNRSLLGRKGVTDSFFVYSMWYFIVGYLVFSILEEERGERREEIPSSFFWIFLFLFMFILN